MYLYIFFLGIIQSKYNFPAPLNIDGSFIHRILHEIYQSEATVFKLNLSGGIILRNKYSSELTYFIPFSNLEYFPEPVLITNRKDLQKLEERMKKIDFLEHALLLRPDSRYKPVLVTNLKFIVTKINYPLGCGELVIPQWLINVRGIILNSKIKDNLCMFRALANHRTGLKQISMKRLKSLFWQWKTYCLKAGLKDPGSIQEFQGIELKLLPHFEICFKTNVDMYEMLQSRQTVPVFESMHRYKTTLNLNKYQNHVSYISDMKKYCRKYLCKCCKIIYPTRSKLRIHQRHCIKQSKLNFPSGFAEQKLTVFEELEHFGIFVKEQDRYYDFLLVYDFESILEKITPQTTASTEITHKHVPVSWACTSNVPGFEDCVCHIDPDPDILVKNLVTYMYKVQSKAKELSMKKWSAALAKLDELIDKYEVDGNDNLDDDDDGDMQPTEPDEPMSTEMIKRMNKPNVYRQMLEKLDRDNTIDVQYNEYQSDDDTDTHSEDDENIMNDDNETIEHDANRGYLQWNQRLAKTHLNKLLVLRRKFDQYITELVALAFNNAKYDNLIAFESLINHLDIAHCHQPYVIKKDNAYHVISNGLVKILDISRYLANGTSYDAFLRSYEIEESKGYFFYEYLSSFEILSQSKLPPIECWFSTLKNKNVLGNTAQEIEQNYEQMQKVWNDNNMRTLADFLMWYNKLDVAPLLKGALKLSEYYRDDHNIDLYKTTITSSGVARILIYRSAYREGASFYQFDKTQADIYALFKKNISGGPSVVFNRVNICGETMIRNNPNEICASVIGLDANALYPNSYFRDFPIGAPVFRWAHKEFTPETCEKYTSMYDYLEYMAHKTGLKIQHKLNSKTEVLLGLHPVDGFAVTSTGTRIVFEYDGCFTHGCMECVLVSPKTKLKYADLLAQRRERTEMRNQYITNQGVVLCIMQECKWRKLVQTNKEIKEFVIARKPKFYRSHPKKCTQNKILEAVRNNQFFGFLLVDLHCPTEWNEHFSSELSPSEYFGEFSPIWATTKVPFEKWGKKMQEFAIQNNISLQPRKLLVGGTSGERLLLLSDLVKW